MYYAVCYVSHVSPKTSENEIVEILEHAQAYNTQNDLTGVLLYSEGNFFHVIEGEKNLIQNLFDKIKADKRHENITTIFERPIVRAAYDGFKSDFVTQHKKMENISISEYLQHIQTLDPKLQSVVKSMIQTFLK